MLAHVRRGVLATIAALATLAVAAPVAPAARHLISVREVYAGSLLNPSSEFVELQMYAGGQQFVGNHSVRLYNSSGGETASATFSGATILAGGSQRSILIATAPAVAQFGVAADLTINAGLDPAGGGACWDTFDCVSWGGFSGSLPSPTGTPATAIPGGDALCRSIAGGDPATLEASDDTDDSAADFAPASPAPRNNAAPATGEPCPGAGGAYAIDTDPPQTKITKGPRGRVAGDTVKFRFKSDEPRSTFKCKAPGKPFRRCRSPKKLKNLDDGRQKFKVFAIDAAGNADPTAAKRRFKVVDR
jgi:hypothetical protein